MEAWQRIVAATSSDKRKAKGPTEMPDSVLEVADGIYVFFQDGNGTIATAYEALPPILATWEEGDGVVPDALAQLLNGYAKQVKAWAESGTADMPKPKAKAKTATATTRVDIPVMIDAKWGQWTPFNDNVWLNGKECPCGCVAMAVALIIYYWGCLLHDGKYYRRGCMAVKSYKTDTQKIKIAALPSIPVFDYKNFTPDSPQTKEGKKAVATFLEYIGKACKSDYTPTGTSAYMSQAYHVLEDNIRLAKKMGYIYSSQIGEDAFAEKVYQSLKAGCPVIMSGSKTNRGCHCFVVDGYNAKTGLFHINYGWYGHYNGWYALSAANAIDYNINKSAITNIKPTYVLGDVDGNGEVTANDAVAAMQMAMNGKYSQKADVNSDGEVSISDAQTIVEHVLGKQSL